MFREAIFHRLARAILSSQPQLRQLPGKLQQQLPPPPTSRPWLILHFSAKGAEVDINEEFTAASLGRGAFAGSVPALFTAKARSLSLDPSSERRVREVTPAGAKKWLLWLSGYYSRESRHIRGGRTLYSRIVAQAEDPALYQALGLPQNFRTTFSMIVLHLWLCFGRLRREGAEGADVGQTMYDVFNHDMENRIVAVGVKALVSKWMKELEKTFYGAAAAYDKAVLPTASQDELPRALWRNVFSEDGSQMPTGAAAIPVQALSRYVRREILSLSMTDSDSFVSGNILFSNDFGASDEE